MASALRLERGADQDPKTMITSWVKADKLKRCYLSGLQLGGSHSEVVYDTCPTRIPMEGYEVFTSNVTGDTYVSMGRSVRDTADNTVIPNYMYNAREKKKMAAASRKGKGKQQVMGEEGVHSVVREEDVLVETEVREEELVETYVREEELVHTEGAQSVSVQTDGVENIARSRIRKPIYEVRMNKSGVGFRGRATRGEIGGATKGERGGATGGERGGAIRGARGVRGAGGARGAGRDSRPKTRGFFTSISS